MTSKALQDVFCLKCGKVGQLKLDNRKGRKDAYRVDHYRSHRRIGGRHDKWIYTCYLGKKWIMAVGLIRVLISMGDEAKRILT